MTVVSIAQVREERQRHWSGPCKCLGCGHEWVGVAPIGVMFVDCPECDLPKGHPKHPFRSDVGDLAFVCNCGSEALTAYMRGGRFWMMCMGCGVDHTHAIFEGAQS